MFFEKILVRNDTPNSFVKLIWSCTFLEPCFRFQIKELVDWIERIRKEEIEKYSIDFKLEIDSSKMICKLRNEFENEIELSKINNLKLDKSEKIKILHNKIYNSIF